MSARTRAATGIWHARAVRAAGDRGYVAYMVLMVGLVMVAPIVRAVWVSATSAEGVALLASPDAPGVAVLGVAAMWAGGLLLGRDRGPALHPPFLTHALADSDLPRSDTFRGPLLRAGALVTAVTTIIAGLVGGSLASHGLSDLLGAAIFTIVGLAVGVVATVAWLAGQAFPRAAAPVAIAVIALGLATVVFPLIQPFTPLGWVGLAYPGSSAPHALVALVALTSALLAAVPVLLNRLGLAELEAQAVRWDSATAYATGMDLSGAAALYQRRPYVGRRARAIRSRSRVMWTFLIRDAVGAVRTPGRLIVGVTALIAGAAILAFAFAPGTPGWLLGAVAGLVVFFGLGPLTDGVRHAASVAGDFPLYGISDQHLLAVHAQFPLAIVVLVLLTAVVVCSILTGIPPAAPLVGALALGPIALLARVSSALKGSLPPALLAPIPTPMGDLGAAARLAWALDEVLLAAAAGAAAALVFQAPVVLVAVTAALLGVGFSRWRHRR